MLTFVAVFHEWLMSPDLFAEEHAAEAPGWIQTIYLWVAALWHTALVWTGVGVAALNLTKGTMDAFIHDLRKRTQN